MKDCGKCLFVCERKDEISQAEAMAQDNDDPTLKKIAETSIEHAQDEIARAEQACVQGVQYEDLASADVIRATCSSQYQPAAGKSWLLNKAEVELPTPIEQ